MKSSEIRQMSDDEIQKAIVEGKRKLLTYRIQRVNGRLEHGHLVKNEKRNIAKCFTILTERTINGRK
jgi:large subunit ribosomal protein L29